MDKYKVLLVDDEEEAIEAIRLKLEWETLGFEVIGSANNGVKALELVERLQPDVVITDIKMPYMDGLELARALNEDYQNIHIIIFTGFDEFEYAKAALQVEAVDYILKPFSFEKIRKAAERVRELLHKEELLKMSVRVYGKKLLCRVIDNDGETGREACRQFLDVCEWDKEEWFGLITTTAGLDDTVIEQVENSLSEVVYSIRGG